MAEIEERVEILRRICERGHDYCFDIGYPATYLADTFNHLLNEIHILKKAIQEINTKS